MESKTISGRVVVMGELSDANGYPVLAVLELNPSSNKGYDLDTIKVASAYGKDTNAQKMINESRMLYVEPNKEKTRTWLKLYKLQLPSSVKYGLNGRISSVNNSISKTTEKSNRESRKGG